AVQFASGLRHDLKKLGLFCRERGILFCVDAIQAIGAMHFDVVANNIDFAMADGHKWMMGPEGLGFLYVRPDLRDSIKLLQFGWHMTDDPGNYDRLDWAPAQDARRFECGSPNMLGIQALSASLDVLLQEGIHKVESAIKKRIAIFEAFFNANPDYIIHSPIQTSRQAGIINFSHRHIENKKLFEKLLQQQVFCALRGDGIRLSPHFYTPLDKISRAIEIIERAV
ncbi:MAG: aminotransferase class V-fold PLP-dependent enzyme, partial [Thiohalomonadales bacterium]